MSVNYMAVATLLANDWGVPKESLIGYAWEASQGAQSFTEAKHKLIGLLRLQDRRGYAYTRYKRRFRKALGRPYDEQRDSYETVVEVLGSEASAKNWFKLYNMISARGINDEIGVPLDAPGPDTEIESKEHMKALLDPSNYKHPKAIEAIKMRLNGATMAEVAQMMGFSVKSPSVRIHFRRIREDMRKVASKLGLEELLR